MITMAYLKPPWFTRTIFNRVAMRRSIGGSQRLTVAGRRSGEPRSVPVVPVDVDGRRYVVSARGETEWVRNVRSAGEVRLGGDGGAAQRLLATELPAEDSAPVIAAYRAKAGRSVAGYWKKLPDSRDHPVFRLDPAG